MSGSDEAEEDDSQAVVPEEFETLDLTLEEARRRYDNEELRRDAVETKIGTVVTVDALIISFGALFSNIDALFIFVVLLPAIISAGLGLFSIRSQEYGKPGFDIDDFHDYREMDTSTQKEHFLLAYEVTTDNNEDRNSTKFTIFNFCVVYTFTSLVLVLLAPLTSQFGIIESLISFLQVRPVKGVGIALIVLVISPPIIGWGTSKLVTVLLNRRDD